MKGCVAMPKNLREELNTIGDLSDNKMIFNVKNRTTLKELATIAGVSISTASKALNDSREISEATKYKIRKLAEKNNYCPNRVASSLRTNKTKTLGIVVPNFSSSFYTKLLSGMHEAAHLKGYHLVVQITNEKFGKELQCIAKLLNGSVDAIMISPTIETIERKSFDHLFRIKELGIGLALFHRTAEEIPCDKYIINQFSISFDTTQYLINKGCRNILFVSPAVDSFLCEGGVLGFKQALDYNKQKVPDLGIVNYRNQADLNLLLRRSILRHKIDAVIAATELSGVQVLNILSQLGISVPDCISVVSFTNGVLSENSFPKLTAIDQDEFRFGALIVKETIDCLESREIREFRTLVHKGNLILRESS